MSADSYAFCPRCKQRADAEKLAKLEAAQSAYGKVPSNKYTELLAAAEAIDLKDETLAEYYEIGIDGNEFAVHYSAGCKVCGFEFRHDFKRPIPIK